MKKLLLFIFVAIAGQVKGQDELINNAYYYNGELLSLPVNYNAFLVGSYISVDLGYVFQQYGYAIDTVDSCTHSDEKDSNMHYQLVKINNSALNLSAYNTLRANLKNTDHLIVEPVLGDEEDFRPLTPYFYIKLKDEGDTTILDSFANSVNVPIVRHVASMPLWCVLKSDSSSLGNSLEMANYFYQSGLFEDIDPGFTFKFAPATCVTDYNFTNGDQWNLYNYTNQNLDIKACQAWAITKGSSSVKVAFIDEGNILPISEIPNVSSMSLDATSPTQAPAPFKTGHVLEVASVVGAAHNNAAIAGVAPNTTLVVVHHDLAFKLPSFKDAEELAGGITWAWQTANVDIINNSWYDPGDHMTANLNQKTKMLEDAIEAATTKGRQGKGCIVTFATGNIGDSIVGYPARANVPGIIAVGNMGKNGQRFTINFDGSNYGSELDIMAPGGTIPVIVSATTSTVDTVNGTSFATPHVSGVAALALAVNPCIAGEELRTIIEYTAQKVLVDSYTYSYAPGRPNGTWNNEMGHGLLDAYRVVRLADSMHRSGQDLYIKDKSYDFGFEANPDNGPLFVTDEIWMRNQQDGLINHTHQNPVYNALNAYRWVYVRVRNKGCDTSSGTDTLKAYWAKAAANLSWPGSWHDINGLPPKGKPIDSIIIPPILPGRDTILEFQWVMPNPANYPNTFTVLPNNTYLENDQHHFCLLARIVSSQDAMYVAETSNLYANVRNNNNIAQKNISIIDFSGNGGGGVKNHAIVTVGDFSSSPANVKIGFSVTAGEDGNPITDEAEVSIVLDTNLWNIWQDGGAQGSGFTIVDENAHMLRATATSTTLENLEFAADESANLAVMVNFLTEESSEKTEFSYDMLELNTSDNSVIGGERFIIIKPERVEAEMFVAEGNYFNSSQQQGLDLNAETISEPVAYRWYTSDTTLVDSGSTIVVNPAQNTTYLLEVTADADGFKDYDPVSVPAQPQSWISSMSPNPATGSVTVGYHLGSSVQNAEVRIVSANNPGTVLITSTLNINQTSKNINTGSLSPGIYIVNLYCDSNNQDGEQLVIQ